MLNHMVYCSWASSSVHIDGPQWTRNSSTYVKHRLCLTFLGSARAIMARMDAFPPGVSLPRRGARVGVGLRLEAGLRLDPFFLLGLKWRTIRIPSPSVSWAVGEGILLKASVMVGCRDAMIIARGEGPFGRVSKKDANMSR
jgi:hypothetical protein